MSHAARMKKLLAPLLESHSDLAMADGWLIVKPVHHLVRGVTLDRTSTPRHFETRWAVYHTFSELTSLPLNFGGWVFDAESWPKGLFDFPEDEISKHLCSRIEQVTLPRLRAMKTIRDYVDFCTDRSCLYWLPSWPREHFRVLLGLGDFGAAHEIRNKHRETWFNKEKRGFPKALGHLCSLLDAEDYAEVARLFREWEATSAKNLKIEDIWEPTPFPFEVRGD
jgi:hypothetical protein